MAAEPELTNEKYAERIGINPATIYKWKKDKEFMDYVHSLCNERFKDTERLAISKLKEQVKKGNWKAIQYVLDSCGYKAETKIDAKIDGIEQISITVDETE